MQLLDIYNPFGAPVFYEETVDSTMTLSRELASQAHPHGTVIAADFQEAGRGRVPGRPWETEKGKVLAFTVLLRYPQSQDIPPALTLRSGLAVSLAIEDFLPALRGLAQIKWPNDIMLRQGKVCGILTEAEGGNVHIGIGVNFAQKEFPAHLQNKAVSIALAAGIDIEAQARFSLLEKILQRLHEALILTDSDAWRRPIEERLYKKGERVNFAEGIAGSRQIVTGCLTGIGSDGELLLMTDKAEQPLAFFSGELQF